MSQSQHIARDVLGPLFERYCYRLWLAEIFHADKNSTTLFLSRGGLRLRWFYDRFLEQHKLQSLVPHQDFYLSRMAVFRALLLEQPEAVLQQISGEYQQGSFLEGMECFLPKLVFQKWTSVLPVEQLALYKREKFSPAQLHGAIFSSAHSHPLVEHLGEQSKLLGQHFREVSGDSREVILVDTGWSGSIIQGLRLLFPEVSFKALLFGRYNYGGHDPEWFSDIVGLEAEGRHYSLANPVTAIFHHRHIVEALCEPPWPSVEWYRRDGDVVVPAQGLLSDSARRPGEGEVFAAGVAQYLGRGTRAISPSKIQRRAESAAGQLEALICYPSATQAELFSVSSRSADFGRDLHIAMLVYDGFGSSIDRVRRSLWLQGQAALEYGFFRHIPQWFITHRYDLKRIYGRLKRLLRRG